jgi:hypothetical protein
MDFVPEPLSDVIAEVSSLTDSWCNRRGLRPLALLLPAWVVNDGLTDGWAAVLDALNDLRARAVLPESEAAIIERSIVVIERAVYRT